MRSAFYAAGVWDLSQTLSAPIGAMVDASSESHDFPAMSVQADRGLQRAYWITWSIGFLLKQLTPADLINAIRAVHGGASVLNAEIGRRILRRISGHDPARPTAFPDAAERLDLLSEREREVLGHVGPGLNNTEIAQRLYMSVSTVKTYVSRTLTKLQLDNRVQAALLASHLRLTPGDRPTGGQPPAPAR